MLNFFREMKKNQKFEKKMLRMHFDKEERMLYYLYINLIDSDKLINSIINKEINKNIIITYILGLTERTISFYNVLLKIAILSYKNSIIVWNESVQFIKSEFKIMDIYYFRKLIKIVYYRIAKYKKYKYKTKNEQILLHFNWRYLNYKIMGITSKNEFYQYFSSKIEKDYIDYILISSLNNLDKYCLKMY